MSEAAQSIPSSVFFDGPRGVALFADLFGASYVCWSEAKPIGAMVKFHVLYGEDGLGIEETSVAVKIIRAVSQDHVESIAKRLDPSEKLARGHWYEVTAE